MDVQGINWPATIQPRIEAATKRLYFFQRHCGYHSRHWRPLTCINVYKGFIRSSLEYGLALQILPTEALARLQAVQDKALRLIFGVPTSTSQAALHLLAGVETMTFRNQYLHARYLDALFNGPRKELPVGTMFHRLRQHSTVPNPPTSVWMTFFSRFHWRQQYSANTDTFSKLDDKWKKKVRLEHFQEVQRLGGAIARSLPPVTNLRRSYLISQATMLPREKLSILFKWKLGRIAFHQICPHCGPPTEVTRAHALTCSNTQDAIEGRLFRFKQRRNETTNLQPAVNVIDEFCFWLEKERKFPSHHFSYLATQLFRIRAHVYKLPD